VRLLDYLFAALLVVMALSIIGLFAMMGELAGRIGGGDRNRPALGDTTLTPVESVTLGIRPVGWPRELAPLSKLPQAAVLVLSNVCDSCVQVAEDLAGSELRHVNWLGFVVSCGSRTPGETFINDTGLGSDGLVYVDEMGDWIQTSFGVTVSPALLQFQYGVLTAADTLVSIQALEELSQQPAIGVRNEY